MAGEDEDNDGDGALIITGAPWTYRLNYIPASILLSTGCYAPNVDPDRQNRPRIKDVLQKLLYEDLPLTLALLGQALTGLHSFLAFFG